MTGEHPHDALSAYLDGELEGTEVRRVEDHLRECTDCTRLLEDLRRLATASREEEIPAAPTDLPDRVLARLGPAVAPRRRPFPFRIPMAAAASLAAVTILVLVMREEPDLRQPSEETLSPRGALGSRGSAPESRDDDESNQGAGDELAPSRDGVDLDVSLEGDVRKRDAAGPQAAGERAQRQVPPARSAGRPPAADAPAGDGAIPEERREEASAPAAKTAPLPAPVGGQRETEAVDTAAREASKGVPPPTDQAALMADLQKQSVAPPTAGRGVATEAVADPTTVTTTPAAAPRSAVMADAVARSSWILRGPDHSILLAANGGLILRAPGYECALPATSPEGETLDLRASLSSEEARVEARGFVADESEDADFATPSTPTSRKMPAAETSTLEILGPDGRAVPVAPDVADAIAVGLRALVQERYTSEVEETCGKLPAPFSAPPE